MIEHNSDVAHGEFKVYFREFGGELGRIDVGMCYSHKDAIHAVKETLVAEGDHRVNKSVLAVIIGGKKV